ncbi:terpene cyclase/mutase family protein, partial [Streptomyces sp. SID3343]|uniref:terpene cyclase/mutase family protein n=1 Tax=Streptomyces sp. SID3343 TaxID=2690260 RepID=UPI00136E943D
ADRLSATAGAYVTWDGQGKPGVLLAGPLAKLTLALAAQGRDVTAIGGLDAEAGLRSLMVTTGADTGRFADRNPYVADNANTFGQAYSVLALARTKRGVPEEAVRYLLRTQCASGGYRLMPGDGTSCLSDADTTALVVQALLTVPRTPQVADSLARAVGWLLSKQDATTGAFGGTGPTAAVNANSTGLIAQTLAATGQRDQTARAAAWLRSMALTEGRDAGALAYNADALVDARANGVDDVTRDQWRRSTAQAVLGLGVPVFGHIGVRDPAPVEPVVPADPGPKDPGPGGPGPGDPGPGGPDPHGRPVAVASPATIRPGQTVTVNGRGFGPGRPVTAAIT